MTSRARSTSRPSCHRTVATWRTWSGRDATGPWSRTTPAETAPRQVVVGGTDAGLIVNAGRYGQTDGAMGEPYLARISGLGALTELRPVPTHDALAAGDRWVAYAPPGTLGGEVPGIPELQVQRLDGSGRGVIPAPDGWLFAPAVLQWESAERLLVPLTSPDGRRELARCRLGAGACAVVDVPD